MTAPPIVRSETRTVSSPRAGEDDAIAAIWRALGAVVDPEMPVVSIVELGIVRDVARDGDAWRGHVDADVLRLSGDRA